MVITIVCSKKSNATSTHVCMCTWLAFYLDHVPDIGFPDTYAKTIPAFSGVACFFCQHETTYIEQCLDLRARIVSDRWFSNVPSCQHMGLRIYLLSDVLDYGWSQHNIFPWYHYNRNKIKARYDWLDPTTYTSSWRCSTSPTPRRVPTAQQTSKYGYRVFAGGFLSLK